MKPAVRSIDSEEAYQAVMRRMQELYDGGEQDSHKAELASLATLVEAYEDRLFQQRAGTPRS